MTFSIPFGSSMTGQPAASGTDGSNSEADFPYTDPLTDRIFAERVVKRTPVPSRVTRYSRPKPGPELTEDDYKQVVKESESKAGRLYTRDVWASVPLLIENHNLIKGKFHTDEDIPGGSWRIDPTQADDDKLVEEIKALRVKIALLKQEIDETKRVQNVEVPP